MDSHAAIATLRTGPFRADVVDRIVQFGSSVTSPSTARDVDLLLVVRDGAAGRVLAAAARDPRPDMRVEALAGYNPGGGQERLHVLVAERGDIETSPFAPAIAIGRDITSQVLG